MKNMFDITVPQLADISRSLSSGIFEGLNKENQQIRCLPTYVQTHTIPTSGRALVLDFGGTNIRAAVVALDNGKLVIEKGIAKSSIPASNGEVLEKETFLSIQKELIASLSPDDNLPLGYCFSYPALSVPTGDAKLIKWTKEVNVKNTVGQPMGQMLLDYLADSTPGINCSKVVVINDTVASLFAGLLSWDADAYIGLIVGTGNNMASFFNPHIIPKIDALSGWKGDIPVNLESGNFFPPHLTELDKTLDNNPLYSDKPDEQRFEKAVSGAYLASLMKLAMPESNVDPEVGSLDVVRIASGQMTEDILQIDLAKSILSRSAKFVAASLAGLITVLHNERSRERVCIAAEGSLFWGYERFELIAHNTLKEVLKQLDMPEMNINFVANEHANLLGSAIAALAS